uniref:Uncharacterized protein n=1 Tax=Rousettus aegyptiacus TaxID=9407 RepID=A0A7J8BE23_ROUAE|nr:hypothetical protein HJG63_009740 [Rousettus aegyptiacus]
MQTWRKAGTTNQRKRKVCVPAVTPLGTAQPPVRKLTGTLSLQVLRPQSLDSETSSWEPHVRPNRTAAVPSSDARRSEPDHSCHRPNCHWSKRPSSLAPHGSHPTQQPPIPHPTSDTGRARAAAPSLKACSASHGAKRTRSPPPPPPTVASPSTHAPGVRSPASPSSPGPALPSAQPWLPPSLCAHPAHVFTHTSPPKLRLTCCFLRRGQPSFPCRISPHPRLIISRRVI